jgi:hypothetical protein
MRFSFDLDITSCGCEKFEFEFDFRNSIINQYQPLTLFSFLRHLQIKNLASITETQEEVRPGAHVRCPLVLRLCQKGVELPKDSCFVPNIVLSLATNALRVISSIVLLVVDSSSASDDK